VTSTSVSRVRYPIMRQNWERLTFLHWRVRPRDMRPLVPSHLALDLFDGDAWVALTPFHLTGLRPPFVPPAPWISRFFEMNLRTYVRGPDGVPGIWFFTLEASRLAAVAGARLSFGLPYHWARMRMRQRNSHIEFSSRRRLRPVRFHAVIHPGQPIALDEQLHFLTYRFRLYTSIARRPAYANVEHEPWPLQSATVVDLKQNLTEHYGIRIEGKPLVHFSPGVHTIVGLPRFIR